MKNLGAAWLKFLCDLSSTRIQITLIVTVLWALIVWHGIARIKTAADATAMLQAITPVVIATVGAWFAGRWLAYNYDEKR
jgi:ABC-type nickel/cobalt efflux system permease component RcnA